MGVDTSSGGDGNDHSVGGVGVDMSIGGVGNDAPAVILGDSTIDPIADGDINNDSADSIEPHNDVNSVTTNV